jgi:hypothetical protein
MLQVNFTGFEQQLFYKEKPFFAKIYEGANATAEGFNVICISLDASERSLLNWRAAHEAAQKALESALLILWDLSFDLLAGSLEDEARFLTFQLNIEHFNETILQLFKEQTFGVSLFRGEIQEGVVDYLKSLAALLPSEVSSFLFLDTSSLSDLASYFTHVNQENFGYLHPIIKGPFAERFPWALPAFAWGHNFSPLGYFGSTLLPCLPQRPLKYGLVLPEEPNWQEIQKVIDLLGATPFRMIAENLLTQEWEGIDTLIIFPQTLTEKGYRKIKGFIAAGGAIINFPDDAALLPPPQTSLPFSPVFLQ